MILPSFLSWGSIDGIDMLSGLGMAVEKASDSFRAIANPKPVYSYNWPGSNGIQFDLNAPIVNEANTLLIETWVLADTLVDLDNKLTALEALLKQSGYRNIYCKKWNKTKKFRLKSFPKNIESPGFANGVYGVQMSIEFDEVYI